MNKLAQQVLETQNLNMALTLKDIKSELDSFQNHLLSSKFHQDPTIQVGDVLNRIAILRSKLLEITNDE